MDNPTPAGAPETEAISNSLRVVIFHSTTPTRVSCAQLAERQLDALLTRLASAEHRLRELEAENRWIPVSERLPEPDGRTVMVGNRNGWRSLARPRRDQYGVMFGTGERVDFWRELPRLPAPAPEGTNNG